MHYIESDILGKSGFGWSKKPTSFLDTLYGMMYGLFERFFYILALCVRNSNIQYDCVHIIDSYSIRYTFIQL